MEKIKEITLPDGWVVDKIENGKVILKEDDNSPYIRWNKEKDGVEVIADGYHFIVSSMPTSVSSNWDDAKILCEKLGGYLPTIDELKVMAKYIKEINQCFKDNNSLSCVLHLNNNYWSNSEHNNIASYYVYTKNGSVFTFIKKDHLYIRAFLRP